MESLGLVIVLGLCAAGIFAWISWPWKSTWKWLRRRKETEEWYGKTPTDKTYEEYYRGKR